MCSDLESSPYTAPKNGTFAKYAKSDHSTSPIRRTFAASNLAPANRVRPNCGVHGPGSRRRPDRRPNRVVNRVHSCPPHSRKGGQTRGDIRVFCRSRTRSLTLHEPRPSDPSAALWHPLGRSLAGPCGHVGSQKSVPCRTCRCEQAASDRKRVRPNHRPVWSAPGRLFWRSSRCMG
jgi:hypothetical protein